MEAVAYARLLRRRWRLVAACAVVAALVAIVATPAKARDGALTYVVDTTVVRDGSNPSAPSLISLQLFMRTGDVPDRVAKRVGYEGNALRLARTLTFEVDDAVGTLTITAPGPSPKEAAALANAFTEETVNSLAEQALDERERATGQLTQRVDQLTVQLADLDRQLKQAAANGGNSTLISAQQSAVQSQYGAAFAELQKVASAPAPSAGLKILEPAEEDLASVAGGGFGAPKSRPVRSVIAGIVGLLLGAAFVLVLERVDPRLVSREAVESAFALPVIASIPNETSMSERFEIFTLTEPASSIAEGFRSLRAALILMPSHVLRHAPIPGAVGTPANPPGEFEDEFEPAVILVTSAAPGDGKSATVANLAVAMAESGREVLVLGYDFRKPSVHKYFGIGGPGVMDVLRGLDKGEGGPSLADVSHPTAIPRLSLVPHGTGEESFGDVAAHGRRLLDQARKLADIVIVDTPPLLVTNDAVELIPAADTTIVVCRSNKTTRDAASRCRDLLERLGASVSGIVLIGDPHERGAYGDYYHYRTEGRGKSGRKRLKHSAGP